MTTLELAYAPKKSVVLIQLIVIILYIYRFIPVVPHKAVAEVSE